MATTLLFRKPAPSEQAILQRVAVDLLPDEPAQRTRFDTLLESQHYLKSSRLVGEQQRYIAHVDGEWLALLCWSAAAYHLAPRDQWIGWSDEQRRRRLRLFANNSRFLILEGVECPNLASRVLALNLARLSADWERAYGHPILAVESFVDGQLFRGTCYKAQGWVQLGPTRGHGRHAEDYYVEHARPKQLWVRMLQADALATLRAPVLPAPLQPVEAAVLPRPRVPVRALHTLVELCRQLPEWRGTKGRDYPLPGLAAMVVLAMLCRVVRGQRDLAAFAAGLSQAQLRALLCRKGRDGRYQAPKETTFYRVLTRLDEAAFARVLHQWSEACLGPCNDVPDTLIALDGKAQRGSTPHCPDEQKAQLVGAVSLPSGRSLGVELVEQKSNEIPAARTLLEKLGPLDGKLVMLDALHANQATLRQIRQDCGGDYLVPVKDNHEALKAAAQACLPPPPGRATPADALPAAPAPCGRFPPADAGAAATPVRYRRRRGKKQPRPARAAQPALGERARGGTRLCRRAVGGGSHP